MSALLKDSVIASCKARRAPEAAQSMATITLLALITA